MENARVELSFVVNQGQAGQRLGVFLKRQGLSTGLIRSLKHMPLGLCVNDARAKTDRLLEAGDRVRARLEERSAALEGENIPLDIVYESSHALVVNKPAGMAVHPTMGHKGGTLANAYAYWAQQQGQPGVFRPIGRLDKNTSGLMLLAKNAHSAHTMQKRAQKQYLALAEGCPAPGSHEICAPLAPVEGSLICQQVSPRGKPSLTRYKVLAAGPAAFLAQVSPLTGRTHQIRVHFAHAGHPLLGDDLYGGSTALLSRHALHCASLVFDEPGRSGICLCAGLPQDMARALLLAKIDWKCEV